MKPTNGDDQQEVMVMMMVFQMVKVTFWKPIKTIQFCTKYNIELETNQTRQFGTNHHSPHPLLKKETHEYIYYILARLRQTDHVASFFLDPYSRPENKRGGAWMDVCVGRSKALSRLPVAYLTCNGSPPVGNTPSLMTFREVFTTTTVGVQSEVAGLTRGLLKIIPSLFLVSVIQYPISWGRGETGGVILTIERLGVGNPVEAFLHLRILREYYENLVRYVVIHVWGGDKDRVHCSLIVDVL